MRRHLEDPQLSFYLCESLLIFSGVRVGIITRVGSGIQSALAAGTF